MILTCGLFVSTFLKITHETLQVLQIDNRVRVVIPHNTEGLSSCREKGIRSGDSALTFVAFMMVCDALHGAGVPRTRGRIAEEASDALVHVIGEVPVWGRGDGCQP
jgi:hypothetical protein